MTQEHTSEPDSSYESYDLLELTRAYIEKWQSLGLMSELAPGEVLVWKRTEQRYHPYYEGNELRKNFYYAGRLDNSELQVGVPYEFEGCTVTANPLSFHFYTDQGDKDREQGIELALRVKRDLLRL